MYLFLWVAFITISVVSLWLTDRVSARTLNLIFVIILIIGAFLISFRPETVPDYIAYKKAFEIADFDHFKSFSILSREPNVGMEYGFIYFMIAFKKIISTNFRVFLFCIALFSATFSTLSLCSIVRLLQDNEGVVHEKKYYSELRIAIYILFFSYISFLYSGIAIRAAIAMTLGLMSIKSAEKGNYVFSLIDFAIAFLFHRMAILIIPLFLLYKFCPKPKYKRTYITLSMTAFFIIAALIITNNYGAISSIFVRLGGSFLGYGSYISGAVNGGRIGLRLILIALIGVICSYSDMALFRLENVALTGLFIATVFAGIGGAERIYDYFLVFYIPVFAMEYCNKEYKALLIFPMMVVIAFNYYVGFRVWGII